MAQCPHCKSSIQADALFCGHCGVSLPPERPQAVSPPGGASSASGEAEISQDDDKQSGHGSAGEQLVWEYNIPILTNRFMLWDFAKLLIITLVIVEAIVFLSTAIFAGEAAILPLQILGLIFGIMAALMVFTVLVVYGNHFNTRFTVTPQAVSTATGRREKRINRVAMLLAFLSGRPGAMGSTLLAYSREDEETSWREVSKVTVHQRERVITLANAWRTVLRLYCPPEIFDEVREKVEAYAAEGAEWRARQPQLKRNWISSSLIAWIALIVAATIASLLWETDDTINFALFAGGLVLLSRLLEGFLRRALAVVALGASLLVLGNLAQLALRQTRSITGKTAYGYEFDTYLLIVAVIGGLVLLSLSGIRLFERNTKHGAKKPPPSASTYQS